MTYENFYITGGKRSDDDDDEDDGGSSSSSGGITGNPLIDKYIFIGVIVGILAALIYIWYFGYLVVVQKEGDNIPNVSWESNPTTPPSWLALKSYIMYMDIMKMWKNPQNLADEEKRNKLVSDAGSLQDAAKNA